MNASAASIGTLLESLKAGVWPYAIAAIAWALVHGIVFHRWRVQFEATLKSLGGLGQCLGRTWRHTNELPDLPIELYVASKLFLANLLTSKNSGGPLRTSSSALYFNPALAERVIDRRSKGDGIRLLQWLTVILALVVVAVICLSLGPLSAQLCLAALIAGAGILLIGMVGSFALRSLCSAHEVRAANSMDEIAANLDDCIRSHNEAAELATVTTALSALAGQVKVALNDMSDIVRQLGTVATQSVAEGRALTAEIERSAGRLAATVRDSVAASTNAANQAFDHGARHLADTFETSATDASNVFLGTSNRVLTEWRTFIGGNDSTDSGALAVVEEFRRSVHDFSEQLHMSCELLQLHAAEPKEKVTAEHKNRVLRLLQKIGTVSSQYLKVRTEISGPEG